MPPARDGGIRRQLVLLVLLLATLGGGASLAAEASRSNKIKADFIVNFARFVTWPENAFADAAALLLDQLQETLDRWLLMPHDEHARQDPPA